MFSLGNSVGVFSFDKTFMLFGYFQVARIFLVFSFFLINISIDISL